MNQEQTARVLGKSQSAIANKLRLLKHSPAVLEALRKENLTERHARALLRLPDEEQKQQAIAYIARMGLSVARTEQYIDDLLQGVQKKQPRTNIEHWLRSVSQTLSRIQKSGIPVVSERLETDSRIVLTITIPK